MTERKQNKNKQAAKQTNNRPPQIAMPRMPLFDIYASLITQLHREYNIIVRQSPTTGLDNGGSAGQP